LPKIILSKGGWRAKNPSFHAPHSFVKPSLFITPNINSSH
jgi:hypothetical protein